MEYAGFAIVPIIMGISEILKQIGVNAKVIPTINLIQGLIFGAGLYIYQGKDVVEGIIVGLVMGLLASGLYSSGKNTIEAMKE
jgi:hypothetical protein